MLVCLKITQTPLEIYALEPKQRKYQKLHLFLLLIVVISMQLLSGHAQVSWYSLLFAAFWMGFWGWRRGKVKEACKNIMYLGICAIIASLLAAVQLIPTFEYLLQSQRASSVDYSYALNYSFWPSHLLNFISPEFFGNPGRGDYWGFGAFWEDAVYFGFIPLVLTFFTFKAFAKNGSHPLRNVILFLWCGFGISLLLALGKNLPPFPFLYRYVPTFNLFQAPARFMIIGVFCLSLLAGLGVEYWNIPTGRWLYITRLGMMGAVAILIGSILGFLAINGELLTTVRALIFTSVSLLLFCLLTTRISSSFAEMKSHLGWSILVGLVIVADLVYSSTYLIPTIDRSFYDLQNQTSLKLPGNERLWIPQNVEYDLKFGRFFRFTDFRGLENWSNIRMVNLPNTNLLAHVSLVNNFDPFVPDRYQKLVDLIENLGSVKRNAMLQLMNVGMIETINTTSRDGIQFEQINNSTSYSWYSCVEFSKDLNDSQSKLSNLLNDPLRSIKSTLIVEAPEHIGEDDCRQTTNIKIDETSETTTQKEFVIQTSEPGWLLISMTYYPGWIAAIDGKEVPIHPAMMALQTVEVPMGQHTILIKYQPQSCYYGAIISGIILIGIIISFLLLKILRKEDPNGSKNHQQSFTRNHFKS